MTDFDPWLIDPNESTLVRLQPGDVELLSGMLSAMLAAPLTGEQRLAVAATRDRILGGGTEPPNLPRAIAAFVDSIATESPRVIGERSIAALEAVCGAGYVTDIQTLRSALESFGQRIASVGVPGKGGDDAAKASADGIDWYEPDSQVFYSPDATTGEILRNLIGDLRHASKYIERGIKAPTRSLFIGKPGCGKTSAAKYIGRELVLPVGLIRLDGIASPLLGVTAKNLRACCEAIVKRGGIIFIDEFDSLGTRRDNASPNVSDEHKKTTGAILQLFDALPQQQIIIACANVASAIDPASARRFGIHVQFGPPDPVTRRAIASYHWRNMSIGDGAMDKLVEITDGRSGDTVEKIAHEAARSAIRREYGIDALDEITVADVVAAANAQPKEGVLVDGSGKGVEPAAVNAVLRTLASAIRNGGQPSSSTGIILP